MKSRYPALRALPLLALMLVLAGHPLQSALVYYIPFDDGTNASLANYGNLGGTATISGTPAPTASSTSVAPNIGSKYSEDWQTPTSTTTGSVVLPNSTTQFRMNTTGSKMSISTWILWDGSYNGSALSGIVNAMNASNNVGWSLSLTSNGTLRFFYNTSSSSYLSLSSSAGAVTTGTWLNVAITLDLSSTSPVNMYVNGSSVYSGNLGNVTLNTTTQAISLGSVDGGRSLNGNMDDFAMWDTALTSAKVKAINTAPSLLDGYNAGVMNSLFTAFDTTGSQTVGSLTWDYSTNFDVTGHSLGDTWQASNGEYYMWLAGTSSSALGLQAVPEPASIWLIVGGSFFLISILRRKRR